MLMTSDEFEAFLADPHLSELLERQKTGNEALDVIRTLEVQHSRFLGWMFDSREGHGQGEEILRDLLMHAALKAKSASAHTKLIGPTKAFFDQNSPTKLHSMSLSSALVLPEFSLTERSRLDLLVLDPQNKFVVIIENKAAAKIRAQQLEQYREDWKVSALKAQLGAGWGLVLIALDLKDEFSAQGSAGGWLLLGYDWLTRAAARADMPVERGNASASLVAAYCKRQLDDAETDADRRSNQLTAELVLAHPEVMAALKPLRPGTAAAEWLKQPVSAKNDLALFVLQHRGAVAQLKEMDFYEALEHKVQQAIPELTWSHTWANPTLLFVQPPGWESFEVRTPNSGSGSDWALEMRVHQMPDASLQLRVWWYAARAGKHGAALTDILKTVFKDQAYKPSLKDGKEQYDRIELGKGLSPERLIGLLNVWQRRLAEAVAQAPLEALA